jgi:hypothetical protein
VLGASWVILGTIGLLKADKKDIPEITRWLFFWLRK